MIVTFYSYKGGVGRTQLVANLASYLALYKNRKILLLDWDLEAPGLDTFFNINRKKIKAGLIELLYDYIKLIKNNEEAEIKDLPFFKEEHFIKKGNIHLIAAGNYNENYKDKINDFKWDEFYNYKSGNYYIEFLKKELNKLDYDYVFIDSRTGVTDYSGICNIQMPEVNVLVVAPSKQNLTGAKAMADDIKNSPYTKDKFRQPIVMPILSRLDLTTNEQANKWYKLFSDGFSKEIEFLIHEIQKYVEIPDSFGRYRDNTMLQYVNELAYGEEILFKSKQKEINSLSIEYKFAVIGEFIEILKLKKSYTYSSVYKLTNSGYFKNKSINLINLTGRQKKELRDAMISAFPTYAELAMVVDYGLDIRLNQISTSLNLSITAYEIIQWAIAHRKLGKLIKEMYNENPENPLIRDFYKQIDKNINQYGEKTINIENINGNKNININ